MYISCQNKGSVFSAAGPALLRTYLFQTDTAIWILDILWLKRHGYGNVILN